MDTHLKDPAANKDYQWDWSKRFPGDPISASTVTVDGPGDLTVSGDSHAGSVVTAWVGGGTHGSDYKVTNHVVTDGGRTDEWTKVFLVRNQ